MLLRDTPQPDMAFHADAEPERMSLSAALGLLIAMSAGGWCLLLLLVLLACEALS